MKLADVEARFYELVTARQSVAATVAGRRPGSAAFHRGDGDERRAPAGDRPARSTPTCTSSASTTSWRRYAKTAAAVGRRQVRRARPRLPRRLPAGPSVDGESRRARTPAFSPRALSTAERPWLADLARLERARLEMVDSADAETLALGALRMLPPSGSRRSACGSSQPRALRHPVRRRFALAIRRPGGRGPGAVGGSSARLEARARSAPPRRRRRGGLDLGAPARRRPRHLQGALRRARARTDGGDSRRARLELVGRWASDGLLRPTRPPERRSARPRNAQFATSTTLAMQMFCPAITKNATPVLSSFPAVGVNVCVNVWRLPVSWSSGFVL